MLLVHGYTGAYDRVSQRVATFLRSQTMSPPPSPMYGAWSPEPTVEGPVEPPSDSTIRQLKQRGYLTTKTPDEEYALVERIARKLQEADTRGMPSYIVMPTYQCNLRCPYCFQDHMRTNPDYSHLLTILDEDGADRIIGAMPAIERRHEVPEDARPTRSVTFFGGEPLLPECRSIVEYFMSQLRARGPARFTAITNATHLHEYRDLLGPDGIRTLQVTLDGPPDEHDKRRIRPDGSGTFDEIAENVRMALDLDVNIQVRMNVDRNNVDQLPELAHEIQRQGWDQYENFLAYTAPIHASTDEVDRSTTMSSHQLNRAVDALREDHCPMSVIRRPDDGLKSRVRHVFDNQHDPLPRFKSSFCGAHTRMYVFDALHDIYACWERTGDKRLRIGSIDENHKVDFDPIAEGLWRKRSVPESPVCRKCRYAFYCGGGCAILAEVDHDTMYMNHCDAFQKRFRAASAEAYVEHVNDAEKHVNEEAVCNA